MSGFVAALPCGRGKSAVVETTTETRTDPLDAAVEAMCLVKIGERHWSALPEDMKQEHRAMERAALLAALPKIEATPAMIEVDCAWHTANRWPLDFSPSAQEIRRKQAAGSFTAVMRQLVKESTR